MQRYVFKLHSWRLRNGKWDIKLPLAEARKNGEIISLASSQVLRWIDELNECVDSENEARRIKQEIAKIKKEPCSRKNSIAIRDLYSALDNVQFKKDYVCIVIDKKSDYYRACKGFSINGVKYVRLLGTVGGIKMSTIVFISERLAPEIRKRIENGRDLSKKFTPAKLDAYNALTCSASVPVSFPHGIAVIKDYETSFDDVVIDLNSDCDGEPEMSEPTRRMVTLCANDGCGMMSPELAERWSNELGLGYVAGGMNTRMSFEKGMVFAFPFKEFAETVSHSYICKDAWGNPFDIREVELILTTSMLKLWDSYSSFEEYMRSSIENKYTFGITKCSPESLESERTANYQFIQSFDLNDDDINELVSPTINEIKDVLGGDWRKTILFLKGSGLNDENVWKQEDDYAKALMASQRMINDPYVKTSVYQLIRSRIDDAKIGVIKLHANYSIAGSDLYALCQSMFGMETSGLLSAGEIYNEYWNASSSDRLVCFRAPMSCHENIRAVTQNKSDDVAYWFRYIKSCTIMNVHDSTPCAENGMD